MGSVAKNITQIGPSEQVSEQIAPEKPWERQKNEPATWYMRFKRYLDMGRKRSLRAAVAGETGTEKATKGTTKILSDVSVPGSWKRASKVWNWVERAAAYDLAEQEKHAQEIRGIASGCKYASRAMRITELNFLATTLRDQIKTGMEPKFFLAVIARYQSVMRDIASEMEALGESFENIADAAGRQHFIDDTVASLAKAAQKTDNPSKHLADFRRKLLS